MKMNLASDSYLKQFQRMRGLVFFVMKKRYCTLLTDDDAKQEAMLALWKAICTYDPQYGICLASYAESCISFALKDYISMLNRYRTISNLMIQNADGEESYEIDEKNPVFLNVFISKLPPHLQTIVKLRAQGYNSEYIASQMNLSKRTIDRYLKKIRNEWIFEDRSA